MSCLTSDLIDPRVKPRAGLVEMEMAMRWHRLLQWLRTDIRECRATQTLCFCDPVTPVLAMEQLPPDLLQLVSASLTGFDVFHLSHTNSALLRATSTDATWRRYFAKKGLSEGDDEPEVEAKRTKLALLWKKQYVCSYSLSFQGLPNRKEDRGKSFRGSFVAVRELPQLQRVWPPSSTGFTSHFGPGREGTSVTIDVWFALKPGDATTNVGGVLFGLQSAPAGRDQWPDYHQQPIVVDSNRQLFCSLLDPDFTPGGLAAVAHELEVNRWYYLAVSYSEDERLEKVYLDGQLVISRPGIWHDEWTYLYYGQVGTGCITANDRCMPVPGYVGYYSFHGVVDEFRIWETVMTDDEIAELAKNVDRGDESSLWYSLRSDNGSDTMQSNVELVRCTRPIERHLELPKTLS